MKCHVSVYGLLFACLLVSMFSIDSRHGIAAEVLSPIVQQTLDAAPSTLVPLSLEWRRARDHVGSVEATLERIKYPPIKVGELRPYKVQLLCDRDKYYCHIWRSSPNITRFYADGGMDIDKSSPMKITEDEASFDGEVCYVGNVVELQEKTGGIPMMRKAPLEKAVADSPGHLYFITDFLTWAGYSVPQSPVEIRDGLRSKVLVDLADGSLVKQEASATSHSIDIESADRVIHYELAPEFGYAVRRRTETTRTGAVVTDATCSDFVQLGTRNVWLPQKISVAWHTWSTIPDTFEKDPILTERFQLTSWHITPIEHIKFVLDYSAPGSAISDAVVEGSEKFEEGYVDYRVPANPEELDAAIAGAVNREVPASRSSIFLIVNAVVVIILAVAIGISWQRRRAQ